jgi:D-sedoheptulose 7-phosphate isomerase
MNKFLNFFQNNSEELVNFFRIDNLTANKLFNCAQIFKNCSKKNKKIILIGNGASASISSHVSVDLTKNAKIRSINFNEANLLTALTNDCGQKKWSLKALEMYCEKGDVVVLISSSGKSPNLLNAAKWVKKKKNFLITFSGFKSNNPLKIINKNGLNFWVNSSAYNHIEQIHLFWLLSIVDFIIGNIIYKVK